MEQQNPFAVPILINHAKENCSPEQKAIAQASLPGLRALTFGSDLLARCRVDAFVGNLAFPLSEKEVLFT